nr:MAG TPA: hypothetical protein [Caudoviricetes sp.]
MDIQGAGYRIDVAVYSLCHLMLHEIRKIE